MMQPNRYTELFFLDEATALAAGHRPCFECRRRDAEQFAMLWAQARNWPAPARAPEMDLVLQAERVGRHGQKMTFMAQLGSLPIGTFIRLPNARRSAELSRSGRSSSGLVAGRLWQRPTPLNRRRQVEVLTPRSVVAVLSAGYRPMLHPSAAQS